MFIQTFKMCYAYSSDIVKIYYIFSIFHMSNLSENHPSWLSIKWSRSVVSDPQQPHGLQPTRLLHPWDFPGKSTGVGCHCLLLLLPFPKISLPAFSLFCTQFPEESFQKQVRSCLFLLISHGASATFIPKPLEPRVFCPSMIFLSPPTLSTVFTLPASGPLHCFFCWELFASKIRQAKCSLSKVFPDHPI